MVDYPYYIDIDAQWASNFLLIMDTEFNVEIYIVKHRDSEYTEILVLTFLQSSRTEWPLPDG